MTVIITILAILIVWSWITKDSDPPALREARTTYWQEPNLARLKSVLAKLEKAQCEIEDDVGLTDQPGAVGCIQEGASDWEDYVDACFEKEKKLWFKAQKEHDRISRQIADLERHQQLQRIRKTPAERFRIRDRRDQLSGPKKPLP